MNQRATMTSLFTIVRAKQNTMVIEVRVMSIYLWGFFAIKHLFFHQMEPTWGVPFA